jgi:hypothetical protein
MKKANANHRPDSHITTPTPPIGTVKKENPFLFLFLFCFHTFYFYIQKKLPYIQMSFTSPTVTENYEANSLLPSRPPPTTDNYDKKSSNFTLRKRHYGVTPVHVLSRTSSESDAQQLPDHNYVNKGFYDCNIW